VQIHEKRITVINLSYAITNVSPSSRAIEVKMAYRIIATGKIETFVRTLPPAGGSV
jgi:hypothetical protein